MRLEKDCMMVKVLHSIFDKLKKSPEGRGKNGDTKLVVSLDNASKERLEALKTKIPSFDENAIVAEGIKCLETKTDRIIRRQGAKKFQLLTKKGYTPEQIAAILNRKNFPVPSQMDKGDSEAVSRLVNRGKAEGIR